MRAATRILAIVVWWVLLLAPSLTVFSANHSWDVLPIAQLAWTLCFFPVLWCVVGTRWFLWSTLPLAFFGAMAVGADQLRHVNLLELLLVSGGTPAAELKTVLGPYVVHLAAAALALSGCAWFIARRPPAAGGAEVERRQRRMAALPVLAGAVALSVICPQASVRAWPMNLMATAYATATQRHDLLSTLLPYAAVNPRDPAASWQPRRTRQELPRQEVYILVVGESVRADRLSACVGPNDVRSSTQPAPLFFCDVVSGSSSTHTSVPLMLSREAPGALTRVSGDASVIKAFAETGFRTYWLSVQEPWIAWPDAQESMYVAPRGTDRDRLLPQLDRILREPFDRKLIVVHALNAHFDYCDRYSPAAVVAPVDCAALSGLPSAATRPLFLASYDNAIQESMMFLDAVIAAASRLDGEVFVGYTSDHGENVVDDERGLIHHALASPTRWDTRVPMVFWSNDRWREAHAPRWAKLADNSKQRVMHADLVPTLLGAAGITYVDQRKNVTDLTRDTPSARTRWVLRRIGEVVDGDAL